MAAGVKVTQLAKAAPPAQAPATVIHLYGVTKAPGPSPDLFRRLKGVDGAAPVERARLRWARLLDQPGARSRIRSEPLGKYAKSRLACRRHNQASRGRFRYCSSGRRPARAFRDRVSQ